MRLFLVTPAENNLHEEVLAEPIRVCTNSDILFKLYDPQNEFDTLVITKGYVDLVGHSIICSALRSYLKPYEILYVMPDDNFDLFINEMNYIKIVPVKADVRRLKPSLIAKALEFKGKIDTTEIEVNVLGRFRNLVRSYFDITDSSAREIYLMNNRDEIIAALSTLLGVANEVETLTNKLRVVESHAIAEKSLIEHYQRALMAIYQRMDRKTERIRQLEDTIINSMDGIEYYKSFYQSTNVFTAQNNNIVLYFKELEDIEFLRFYESIYKLLKIRGVYVKSLIIGDKSYMDYEQLGYRRCADSVTLNYISEYDKLVRMGPVRRLLEILASEQFRIEVLMIYDKGRELKPCIESNNMTTMYIGKYRGAYTGIDIPDSSFISPVEGDWISVKELLCSPYDKGITDMAFETYVYRHNLTNTLMGIVKEQLQGSI